MQVCVCYNGGRCNPVNGACDCPAGFFGPLCQHKCPRGWWGAGCRFRCTCFNPRNGETDCDPLTGRCICKPGYTGDRCDQVCPRGYHGEKCAQRCKYCEDCHFETGRCLCDLGQRGKNCKRSKKMPRRRDFSYSRDFFLSSTITTSPPSDKQIRHAPRIRPLAVNLTECSPTSVSSFLLLLF
ncbi:unnamed protein product [Hydatigera taeniaeformis]|uniref:EGF-like domain-containing protein n=1 Tax=Hydatigena taeniaeformis TaxID=6205 RepID=A0A0R3WXI8_HYDTA|nr:unnamed protein product [Hydatigera taeniaeformis]